MATAAEQTAREPEHVVDVSDLAKIASPSVLKRIKEVDIDKDGNLSMQELIQLVQSEQKAHADRRLFRNFLIALVVAVLILVAALVGAVYGIVKLTDEVDDNNGVLVSANTGTVMATGKATNLLDLSKLYSGNNSTDRNDDGHTGSFPDVPLAQQLEVVVMPQAGGGYEVHRVASVRSFPGEQRAIIVSMDGSIIEVGTTGLVYLRDAIVDSLDITGSGLEDASPGRRLRSASTQTGYGVGTRSTPAVPDSCTSSMQEDMYLDCMQYHCDYDYVRNGISCEKQCSDKFCSGSAPAPDTCEVKFSNCMKYICDERRSQGIPCEEWCSDKYCN
ncbi:hypothetical protein PSENEW3_00004671 [Picochlorum sp. SENEW3]|nr:hypothetical protein PSENEW3_00004671 [Picochlorum sp. SENEW3]